MKYLLVKGMHGFGNRFYCLMNAIVYAKATGRTIIVDWRDGMYADKGVNAFDKLFTGFSTDTGVLNENMTISNPLWKGNLDKSVFDMIGTENRYPQTVRQLYSSDISKDYSEDIVVYFEYYFNQKALSVWGEIPSEKKLLSQIIPRLGALSFSRPTIGVHIRATDHYLGLKYPSIEEYKQVLDTLPNYQIFLCTDNEEVEFEFKKLYPSAIVTKKSFAPKVGEPIHFSDGDKLRQAEEALNELYLLVGCEYIVCSEMSTFGIIASRMSTGISYIIKKV